MSGKSNSKMSEPYSNHHQNFENDGVQNPAYVNTEIEAESRPPGATKQAFSIGEEVIKIYQVWNQPLDFFFFLEEPNQPEPETKGCSLFGFRFRPCEKVFLSAAGILVFLCWASTIQGMVINGFVNVVISTLERRFGLRSTETGVIAGSYDIGSMLSVIPISYFGGRIGTSKPRWTSDDRLWRTPDFKTSNLLDTFPWAFWWWAWGPWCSPCRIS